MRKFTLLLTLLLILFVLPSCTLHTSLYGKSDRDVYNTLENRYKKVWEAYSSYYFIPYVPFAGEYYYESKAQELERERINTSYYQRFNNISNANFYNSLRIRPQKQK
jgi:hypothetical protein